MRCFARFIVRYGALVALGAVFAAGPAAAALTYTTTEITRAGFSVRTSGLNDSGQIVGWAVDASGTERGFVYEAGSYTDIGTLKADGSGDSRAHAISNNGQVTGTADTDYGPGSYEYSGAFVWQNGVLTDLTGLAMDDDGVPYVSSGAAINAAGDIALNTRYQEPFSYVGGTAFDLGGYGAAIDINSAGLVLVNRVYDEAYAVHDGATSIFYSSDYHGTVRINGITDSGWLYGHVEGDCNITCNEGRIYLQDATGAQEPLLRGPMSDWVEILHLTDNGWAAGVNNAGELVVSSALHDGAVTVASLGIDVSNWVAADIVGINSHGDFLIEGRDAQANYRSFYVTTVVPIPAAAWLFGSALVGLAGWGRLRART